MYGTTPNVKLNTRNKCRSIDADPARRRDSAYTEVDAFVHGSQFEGAPRHDARTHDVVQPKCYDYRPTAFRIGACPF